MTEPLLSVRGLEKTFRTSVFGKGHVMAVRGVSFELGRSECVALVGESGSGKSTTARCILQLERPDAGEVIFAGRDLTGLRGPSLRDGRRGMQVVFQDPLGSLDSRLTLADSVAEALHSEPIPHDERQGRVMDALSMVGIAHLAARRPFQISGGEAQRAAIARAIVARPSLVVLDEAVSSLDVSIQAQILNLLRDLQRELGMAYLFISHDLAVVSYLADRVVIMSGGQIVEQGETASVIETPASEYGARLIAAARALETADDARPVGG